MLRLHAVAHGWADAVFKLASGHIENHGCTLHREAVGFTSALPAERRF